MKKPDLSRADALASRPIRAAEAEMSIDESGNGRLNVVLQSPRWGGWLFRMPAGATKTFEFDEIGVLVWNCCDGTTSVQQIIRKLAKQYNLNLREAEVSTIRFLQMLVKRGLIAMSVKKKDDKVTR